MINSPRFGHAGFRPLLYEGGPALIQLLKRLMPLVDCDIPAIRDAYSSRYLDPLLDTNANVFFLLFSPGMDAETEKPFYAAFSRAAKFLEDQGCVPMACISVGHAADSGVLRKKGWFAARQRGRRIPSWIPGFNMTCWNNAEWEQHVSARAVAAFEHGAHGVCFDTIINGATPAVLGPHILGPTGCSCRSCRDAFAQDIPDLRVARAFPPRSQSDLNEYMAFIQWRAGRVAKCIGSWADSVRKARPGALVAANLLHPALANATLLFGADTAAISSHCDIVLCQTNNLINFEKRGLTYDGATLDIVREYAPGKDVCGLPWHAGPHIESEPRAALWRAALGEAAACGAPTAPHVSVLFDHESLAPATLSQKPFEKHRRTLGEFWNWLDQCGEMFDSLEPYAPIALIHDADAWLRNWCDTAPAFLKMYATLAELHLPFRVLAVNKISEQIPDGLKIIIIPQSAQFRNDQKKLLHGFPGRLLFLGKPPEWAPDENCDCLEGSIFHEPVPGPSQRAAWRSLTSSRHNGSPAPYMQHRAPAPGALARILARHGKFQIPDKWKQIFEMIQALGVHTETNISIEAPPYITAHTWSDQSRSRIIIHAAHMLPGFDGPKLMRISVPNAVSTRIMTPDRNRITYVQEPSFTLEIITYAAIEIRLI